MVQKMQSWDQYKYSQYMDLIDGGFSLKIQP